MIKTFNVRNIFGEATGAGLEFKAKVVDASGNEQIKTQNYVPNYQFPSQEMIIPLTPLPAFPLTASVKASQSGRGGTLMFSTPELIADLPISLGCFDKLTGENAIKESSPQLCLVHCKAEGKRFGLLSGGEDCSCWKKLDHAILKEVTINKCNIQCSGIESHIKCGGSSASTIFVAGNSIQSNFT